MSTVDDDIAAVLKSIGTSALQCIISQRSIKRNVISDCGISVVCRKADAKAYTFGRISENADGEESSTIVCYNSICVLAFGDGGGNDRGSVDGIAQQ